MITIPQAARDADPRPPFGTPMVIEEDGRRRSGTVQYYHRGDRQPTFQVRDDLKPYAWHDLRLGDPRIVDPPEFGPQPKLTVNDDDDAAAM